MIRDALRQDIPELLRLMQALARFEGYADDFAVTAADLEQRGFGPQPQFHAKLATDGEHGRALGMAVYLLIPYTYDLRPTLLLKELYVEEHCRGRNIGEQLLRAVAQDARRLSCGHMRWDVLSGNGPAERFYRRLGGRREERWIAYRLDREGIDKLS